MNDHPRASHAAPVFSGYRPTGGYDEAVTAEGELRPHWRTLAGNVNSLGARELSRRWEQAQRQITSHGVTYNPLDDAGAKSRPWVLDAIPMVVNEQEWVSLTEALQQRATLLDLILRDLFGPQRLLKDKIVPPDLLFGHPGFFPAYEGLQTGLKRHLHLYAADLARAADGTWWVTGERTRAPFGLGYVLESRIVTARMLPAAFRQCRVQRLAPFYIQLQETLRELATRFKDNPRIALWTRGPSSRSYFEDAYLARYLGYTLAEGGDLAVRENRVMLKTLGGLLPVEVLFRRLDDEDCDPVELNPASMSGVPGLLEVVRTGNVSLLNPLGSRLVESPIWLAFMPKIAKALLGDELRIPSVGTWWCGQPEQFQHVLKHLDQLLIRPAFRTGESPPVYPASLSAAERAELIARLRATPDKYVAQETVVRSTAPVWSASGPQPWHLAVRTFLVAAGEGYTALPGALARVSADSRILDDAMTSGERSQDLWVQSQGPIEQVSLLPSQHEALALRRSGAELPSRVADNLYWLGRSVERAEGAARLLRTTLSALSNEWDHAAEELPLLRALAEQGQIEPDYVVSELSGVLPDIREALPLAVFDTRLPRSLRSTVNEVVRLASTVRDRLAIDMWRTIRRVDEACRRPDAARAPDATEVLGLLDEVIGELLAFAGLVSESMTRTQGWRFLDLGRRIERAWQTAMLLRSTLCEPVMQEFPILESVLQTADSVMTYRSRYLASLQLPTVLDLLLTDETNPRSIGFQIAAIAEHVDQLPRSESQAVRSPEQRLALSLLNAVRLADVFELSSPGPDGRHEQLDRLLKRLCDQLPKLSDAVSGRFLIHAGLPRHFAVRSGGQG
ncbi:MAG: circularly permuted type 2 ATP-grasp protein [Planctomycetaceae bacterium]|nr:circularly permuted type 2 ATP-grasp protein [Planctomycetaceae bacterium]